MPNDDLTNESAKAESTLARLVREFLEYCEIDRGHSPLTVSNYSHYLDRFLFFCQQNGLMRPQEITQDSIHEYRQWLNRLSSTPELSTGFPKQERLRSTGKKYILPPKPLSKLTQNYHLIALRSFLKFLARRDIASLLPDRIELAKTDDRIISFLDRDEISCLLSAPKPVNLIGTRDAALIALLFSTGLRVSELTNLNRDQVNLKADELTVIGKGGKARLVFLSDSAKYTLANYLKRRRDKDPALFIRHGKKAAAKVNHSRTLPKISSSDTGVYTVKVSGQAISQLRLTPRSVQRIVKGYAKHVGIMKEVHPHTLRHSYATDLLGNGADIRSVQQLLGHSSITTTQIYTHVTNKQLRDIHKKYHAQPESTELNMSQNNTSN